MSCRGDRNLIRLLPVSPLLKFDLTSLLDEVANVATTGGEAVGTTVAGDVVAATSAPSLN